MKYKTTLSRDEKINDLLYDDISYALALFYALKESRKISFKMLSKELNEEEIYNSIRFAHLDHTQPFPQSVSDLSEILYKEEILPESGIDIPTYTTSHTRTGAIRRTTGIISKEEKINPVKFIYKLFSSGEADKLILEQDNETMLPPTNILVDKYRNII